MKSVINKGKLYAARVTIDGVVGTVCRASKDNFVEVVSKGIVKRYEWKYFHATATDLNSK